MVTFSSSADAFCVLSGAGKAEAFITNYSVVALITSLQHEWTATFVVLPLEKIHQQLASQFVYSGQKPIYFTIARET